MPNRALAFLAAHKVAVFFTLVAVVGGGYFGYQKYKPTDTRTRYFLASVERGTLVVSVTGSGQLAAVDAMDVKPRASGQLTAVRVKTGEAVKTGQIIAQIDTADAFKAVRDAETSLETAELSLDKLMQPVDALSQLQSQNSLAQAKENRVQADVNLQKSYDDAFNAVADAVLDLPGVMTGLEDVLFKSTVSPNQANVDAYADIVKNFAPAVEDYKTATISGQQAARVSYDATLNSYKTTSRYSSTAVIEDLLAKSYDTSVAMAEAVKNANNYLGYVNDQLSRRGSKVPSAMAGHLNSLAAYTGTLNGHIQTLLSRKEAIQSAKNSIINYDRTIAERQASYDKLVAGPDALDIRTQDLNIRQRQDALADANKKLEDYTVRAPFDGVIAKLNVKKGDEVSSGTALATVLTTGQIAEVSLNEVDVAKVAVGQRATMTFDAVEDLTLTGGVLDIDEVGTVSQGVVNYAVKLSLDVQDDRVKPGMTVSAAIITEAKTDVLLVPAAAVKANGQGSYVEMTSLPAGMTEAPTAGLLSGEAPRAVSVQVGASNDTQTEINGGLQEGQWVVTRSVTAAQAATQATGAASSTSGLRLFGGGGAGGGNQVRVPGR